MQNGVVSAMEKKHADKVEDHNQSKRLKRLRSGKFKEKSLDEHKEAAKQLVTEHDKNWATMDEREDMEKIKTLLTKSFWRDNVAACDIMDEVKRVFPHYWQFYKKSPKKGKNHLLQPGTKTDNHKTNLGKYFELVRKISQKKEKDIISSKRRAKALKDASEYEYLTEFVKFSASQKLAEQEDSAESEMDKMRSLIESNGSKISNQKRWKQPSTHIAEVEVLFQSTYDRFTEGGFDD